jgi:cysteinyl-tRNA synthetase
LHDIANNLNKAETVEDKQHYKSLLLASADVMGLLYQNAEDWFKGSASEDGISEDEINQLIAERLAAKKSKDWAKADAIRNQLKDAGIVLEDTPQGTSWKRA